MSVLSVRNLCVSAANAPILQDISFDVGRGEIVALTGESGSGKSMTALAIMRLLPDRIARSDGKIALEGADLTVLSEGDMCRVRGRRIGMVFQEPMTALNPVKTIGDQVAEAVRLHSGTTRSGAEARAREMLGRVGLPEARFPLSRYPHELSGGQRQRVVIALAIVQRPKLLIADEPTTALDVTTQAQILNLLKGLVSEFGMGMILITHDLAVVAGMADRLVVMRGGAVMEQGPTEQVLRERRHPYTKALLEASGQRMAGVWQAYGSEAGKSGGPLLQVEAVKRTYAGPRRGLLGRRAPVTAVDGVSLSVGRGERVGLVGESGCGKSTLTRAILGLEPVQEGRIRIGGAPVEEARGRIQVVFQDPYGSFNPRHRVRRLVAEPFHLLERAPTRAERAARVAEVLEAVGLKDSDAGRYIHEFSGGQRQRIAIARALILRPELIVLDEAVSALDVSVRARILDLLEDLSRRYGLAYLFISHDLSVVRGVTSRVLVMKAGRIVEEGPTEEVFNAPRHPYTRELIAAAPVLPDWAASRQDARGIGHEEPSMKDPA